MKKDVIYIDIDDEITTITDKVVSSTGNIVALVLPKHCPVLQSSVNMKILNKTSKDAGKRVVFITSEASLLPIAGAAGIFVAKTLQSKPYLPKAQQADEKVSTIDEQVEDVESIDTSKPIGELALAGGGVMVDDDAPIELGDDIGEESKDTNKKSKKDRKLRVPNFEKFRFRLALVVLAIIILISGGVYAVKALPKATATVTTQNKPVTVNLVATGSPTAKAVDMQNNIVPAQVKTIEKPVTSKFQATGEKNIGNKASGKVVFYNCSVSDKLGDVERTVPAGTGISSGGLTFITQSAVKVQPSNIIGTHCLKNKPSDQVSVVAQNGGDKYNVGSRTYDVAGFSTITALDEDGMGGGTNEIIKAVSQSDCDSAKNALLNTKTDDFKNQLAAQLSSAGFLPIRDTFAAVAGDVTCSPAVGEEAAEATATVQFKLSMTGASIAGLDQLVKAEVSKQVKGQVSVFDTGVASALVTVKERKDNGDVVFNMQTDAQTGIEQDSEAIANLIAGKKHGESVSTLKEQPGVVDAQVDYSPFWVTKTPKDINRITVNFINK